MARNHRSSGGQGSSGRQGPQGRPGSSGRQGSQGRPRSSGRQGSQGRPSPSGRQGSQGSRPSSSGSGGSTSAAGFEIYRTPKRRFASKLVSLGFGLLLVGGVGTALYGFYATDELIKNVQEGNNLATFSAYALALRGPVPEAHDTLLAGLNSDSPALRGACARACGKYKEDMMIAVLGELAITDPVPTVRVAALDGLAHNDQATGVHRYLLQILQEEDDQEVLVAACETTALLGVDVQRVFQALLELIQDHRGRVAGAAVRAMESLTDMKWGNDVLAWKRWYGQEYGGY